MICIIPNDKILVLFQCEVEDCPDRAVVVESSVEDILQVGTPMCESCEEEMECLGTAEVEVTVYDELISPD